MNDTPNNYGDTVKNDLSVVGGYAKSAGSGIFNAITNLFTNYPMAKNILGALAGGGLASMASKFITAKLPFGGGLLSFVAMVAGAILGFRAPMLLGQSATGGTTHKPDNLSQEAGNTGTNYTPYRSTDDSGIAPIDRGYGSIYRTQDHNGGTPATIITPSTNPNAAGSLSHATGSNSTRNMISSNTGTITAPQGAGDDNSPSAAEGVLLSSTSGKLMPHDLKSVLDNTAPPSMDVQNGNDIHNVIYLNPNDITRNRSKIGLGMVG